MSLNIKHKRSAVDSKAPLPADLNNGEIAVNYNSNSPAAYIKDSAGAVVQIAGVGAVGTAVPATETVSGTTELATQAETNAGTDDTRSVTPLKVATRYVSKDAATGGASLPSGTTAQRPTGPVGGEIRLNTDTTEFEGFDGTGWTGLKPAEVATQSEIDAGTDDTKIVTPLKAASTFVNVSGDTMTGLLNAAVGMVVDPNTLTSLVNGVQKPTIELGAPGNSGKQGHLYINGPVGADYRLLLQWGSYGSTHTNPLYFNIKYDKGYPNPNVIVCTNSDGESGTLNTTVRGSDQDGFRVNQKKVGDGAQANHSFNFLAWGYVRA